MSFFMTGAEKLLNLLYPEKCIACGRVLTPDSHSGALLLSGFFCRDCTEEIIRLEDSREIAVPFSYEGAVRQAMLRLKFSGDISSVRFFSAELEREVRSYYYGQEFDLITCVPSTEKSLKERGYNQSRLIAEGMDLDIPSDYGLLKKNRDTGVQHLLSAEGRAENIKSAYTLNRGRDVSGLRILLVDDIYTTGATCRACAFVLKSAGAKDVSVACVCKSPKR